jgi:bacteriocin-like protein
MEVPMSKTNDSKPIRELTEDELSLVSGGAANDSKAEAQIFQALSSAISDVMKNFGGALNTAARGG